MTNAFIVGEEGKEEGFVRLLQEEEELEATTTVCGSRNLKVSNHNKKEEKA